MEKCIFFKETAYLFNRNIIAKSCDVNNVDVA